MTRAGDRQSLFILTPAGLVLDVPAQLRNLGRTMRQRNALTDGYAAYDCPECGVERPALSGACPHCPELRDRPPPGLKGIPWLRAAPAPGPAQETRAASTQTSSNATSRNLAAYVRITR